MPAILNEAVPATTQNVDGAIQRSCDIAFKYTGKTHRVIVKTVADCKSPPNDVGSLSLLIPPGQTDFLLSRFEYSADYCNANKSIKKHLICMKIRQASWSAWPVL